MAEHYQISVVVPSKIGQDWINRFFEAIADEAYEVQESFDKTNANRDWDIFVFGGPYLDDDD